VVLCFGFVTYSDVRPSVKSESMGRLLVGALEFQIATAQDSHKNRQIGRFFKSDVAKREPMQAKREPMQWLLPYAE